MLASSASIHYKCCRSCFVEVLGYTQADAWETSDANLDSEYFKQQWIRYSKKTHLEVEGKELFTSQIR